jgi:hypothetical protein
MVVLIVVGMSVPATKPSVALNEAVARKCHQLVLKTFPRPKNYAAYKGGDPKAARLRQDWYKRCIAKDGQIEN